MKRELAGSDKQGLAPNILPFFFGVAIAGSDKQGLAPKNSAVLLHSMGGDLFGEDLPSWAWLPKFCRWFFLHGMGSQSAAGPGGGAVF